MPPSLQGPEAGIIGRVAGCCEVKAVGVLIMPAKQVPTIRIDPLEEADDVLSVGDAAALLKVGRNCLYDAIARGEIPHRRIGKHLRLSRHGLMRWLESWSSQGAKKGQ